MSFTNAAVAVIARLFRLVKPNGSVVGEFVASDSLAGGSPSLRFWHNALHLSLLSWTNPDGEPGLHELSLINSANGGGANNAIVLSDNDSGVGTVQIIAMGEQIITASGTIIRIGGPVSSGNTYFELNPNAGGILLNSRVAKLIVSDQFANGGDTGNVAGPATTGAMATVTVNGMLASDEVNVWWEGFIGCAVGGGIGDVTLFIDGVSTGYSASYSANVAGQTISCSGRPARFTPGAGNHTFDLRFTVGIGGTYRCFNSTIHVQVTANN